MKGTTITINLEIDPEALDALTRARTADIRYAEAVMCTPGVTVDECRAALGLPPLPNVDLGSLALNLPTPA